MPFDSTNSSSNVPPCTPEDIKKEHDAALASLSFDQRKAVCRLQQASRKGNFNHHTHRENMERIFSDEAEVRNKTDVEGH